MKARVAAVVAVLAALAVPGAVGQTWSAFTGQTANPGSSLAAQRVFSGTRTTSAWNVRDYASGTLVDRSDPISFVGDSRASTSNPLPTAFSTAKYVEMRMESSLPNGLAVSGATLRVDLARAGTAGTLSFFVEVRRVSTGTVIATHGSAAAPVGTVSTSTQTPFSVSLPEVDTSNLAADLAIRIYAWDTAAGQITLNRLQVDGSTPHGTFTLLQWSLVEAFGTTPTTYPWALVAADAAFITTSAWPTASSTSRYLSYFFDPDLPAGATVTGVTLTHAFRAAVGGASPQQCFYYEARSGATVLSTHFSSASPSCTTSTSTFKTDTLSLPAVDTAAKVNGLEVRIYGKSAQGKGADLDRTTLAVTYGLN